VLGRGGMGEVWRATDGRLDREVALKVLPEDFAKDQDRHARFEREAKVLASLNHPGIATLYGLEHLDGQHVLVMELVEGEGLDDVIARGPIPIDEAIAMALQIADALEAAHEAGIVHRDLKPANIRVRPDGTLKVLDFGLAKARESAGPDTSLSTSPTVTCQATVDGVILGTAAYMSPEQARGKMVDRKADIWAFGVVLWEMLSGTKLFEGDTVSDQLAAVLTRDLDLDKLPPSTPPSARRLLARCLERDSKNRLQWIGDARLELIDALAEPTTPRSDASSGSRSSRMLWALVALLAVIAAAAIISAFRSPKPGERVVRFSVDPPEGSVFHLEGLGPGPVALSPDGSSIAFSVRDETGEVGLCFRRLDEGDAECLDVPGGGQYPFWSPDGSELGFFTRTGAALRVMPADGGSIRTVCSSRNGKGGTWNRDGVIVFAPDSNTPLYSVPAAGGEPRPLTTFDEDRGDNSHRHPWFLPDGRRLLYMARSVQGSEANTVVVGSLDGDVDVEIMQSPVAAQYVAGRLLYLRGTSLLAHPFDLRRLAFTGEEVELTDGVMVVGGAAKAIFSATHDVLTYQRGEYETRSELVWLDRAGERTGVLGDVASYYSLAVSPDGRRVAVPITNDTIGTHDLWIYDVERNLRSRVTFDAGEDLGPVWAPDGRGLYFSSNRAGPLAVYRVTPGESDGPELVVGGQTSYFVTSVSPDGKRLVLSHEGEHNASDLFVLELSGSHEPEVFRASRFVEEHATYSPDGRWVAYTSDESGRPEVYVIAASGTGRHWQLSTGGGIWPRWVAATGEVIFQDTAGRFVAIRVDSEGPEIVIGATEILFEGYPGTRLYQLFDPSPDGSRILYRALSAADPPDPPTVVINWLPGSAMP